MQQSRNQSTIHCKVEQRREICKARVQDKVILLKKEEGNNFNNLIFNERELVSLYF